MCLKRIGRYLISSCGYPLLGSNHKREMIPSGLRFCQVASSYSEKARTRMRVPVEIDPPYGRWSFMRQPSSWPYPPLSWHYAHRCQHAIGLPRQASRPGFPPPTGWTPVLFASGSGTAGIRLDRTSRVEEKPGCRPVRAPPLPNAGSRGPGGPVPERSEGSPPQDHRAPDKTRKFPHFPQRPASRMLTTIS